MFSHDLISSGVGVAALVWIALWTSHQLADHWIQTGFQAIEKDKPRWLGRLACAGHVAGHMVTSVVCLLMLRFVGLDIHAGAMTAGLAVIAISHYWCDRRTTLRALADRLGKGDFYRLASRGRWPCSFRGRAAHWSVLTSSWWTRPRSRFSAPTGSRSR